MKRRLLLAAATGSALMLGGCASQSIDQYRAEKPELDLKQYFNGTLDAYGVFDDPAVYFEQLSGDVQWKLDKQLSVTASNVRFANADNVVTGVQWQASTGRLALGTTLQVQ